MKNYCDRLSFLTALAVMITAAPATAVERTITDIELEKNNHQLELKLSGTNKNNADASFYSLHRGNIIEANLLNTDLDLPEGNSFKQENPLPGVKAIEIDRIDRKHTRVIISTEANTAIEHLLEERENDLILSLNQVTKAQSLKKEIEQFGQKTVKNIKQSYKSALGQKKTKDDEKPTISSDKQNYDDSDVLVPNPEIVIDDNRLENIKEQVFQAQEGEPGDSPVPATLPRAVAPPVGDMAVSNINTMPDMVDLGSSALVPRLVLRDAPVREVLSLLARSANLNVVYAGGGEEGGGEGEGGPTISLDLENQPVQEVFNSVLLISGLDANRKGNIVYVGEQLPAQARNLVSRTIRLNQVSAENAAYYLATQGASGKVITNEVEEVIDPETGRVVQRTESSPELTALDEEQDETGTKALMLQGLQVSTDGRLNSITLVGEPRKVEIASTFLTQLDARRRQVAVNVKVLDVNLLNQDVFNSSFSFGVNDSFFVQERGAASLRFGDTPPVDTSELNFGNIEDPSLAQLPSKFLASLEAQISSGNAKILTDPTLMVQEGQQATVKLAQNIIESVQTDIDGETGTRTITPVIAEAGVVLTVNVEQIDDNGFVSMSVSPTVSSIGATQNFDSGGGAVNLLNLLSKRELSSGLVRLRDGQTLILSGIIQDQERTTVSKVPILGDIPLLGSLFRSTDKANERAEVIVLLTPEIIEEDAGLASNFSPGKESREMLKKQGVEALDN